jgi:hypothetical protein
MIKHLFFFFSVLFFNFSQSQDREAKLLLKNNNSVEGLGEIKKNKIYFRLSLDEKPEVLTEDDAKGIVFIGYRLPEKYVYIVHGKKNEAHLMEVLQEGSVELYRDIFYITEYNSTGLSLGTNSSFPLTNVNSTKNIDYYIKKLNEVKAIKVTMDFKKIGQIFFSDCEDLITKINEEDFFEIEEIIDLVKFYNYSCGK